LVIQRTGVYADAYNIPNFNLTGYVSYLILGYAKSIMYLFGSYLKNFRDLHYIAGYYPPILTALFATLFVMLLSRTKRKPDAAEKPDSIIKETKQFAIFGLFLIVIGLFPYIMVYGNYSFGPDSRHGLLAGVGLAVFIASIICLFYYKETTRAIVFPFALCIVFFLGAMQCNIAMKSHEEDWKQQCAFWREFIKRVPDLKDNTFLVIDMPREQEDYFGIWRGAYEISAPLNLFYAKSKAKKELNNHYAEGLEVIKDRQSQLSWQSIKDKEIVEIITFKGKVKVYTKNMIIASFKNGKLSLNKEIAPGLIDKDGGFDAAAFLKMINPRQILYRSNAANAPLKFPFRKIFDKYIGIG